MAAIALDLEPDVRWFVLAHTPPVCHLLHEEQSAPRSLIGLRHLDGGGEAGPSVDDLDVYRAGGHPSLQTYVTTSVFDAISYEFVDQKTDVFKYVRL